MAVSPVPAKTLVQMLNTDVPSIWFLKDNPRLFNNPPRSSKEWKLEYNARTSAERSNKREKLDFKLETADTAQLRCGTAASITS